MDHELRKRGTSVPLDAAERDFIETGDDFNHGISSKTVRVFINSQTAELDGPVVRQDFHRAAIPHKLGCIAPTA
jgi:hypothetical protein